MKKREAFENQPPIIATAGAGVLPAQPPSTIGTVDDRLEKAANRLGYKPKYVGGVTKEEERQRTKDAWSLWKWFWLKQVAVLSWMQGACYRVAGDYAYQSASGEWHLISALENSHLRNILKKCYRNKPAKKSDTVHMLEREYEKRKLTPSVEKLCKEEMNALERAQLDMNSRSLPLGFLDGLRNLWSSIAIGVAGFAVTGCFCLFLWWITNPFNPQQVCSEWGRTMQYDSFKAQAGKKEYTNISQCSASYKDKERVRRLLVSCTKDTCSVLQELN
jgi:hypothetical protein